MRMASRGEVAAFARAHLEELLAVFAGIFMLIVGFSYGPGLFSGPPGGTTSGAMKYMAYASLATAGALGLASMLRFGNRVTVAVMSMGVVLHLMFLASCDAGALSGDNKAIVRMLLYILGAFCVVFSLGLMLGHRHNTLRLEAVMAGYLALNLFRFLFDLHHGTPFVECLASHKRYNVDAALVAMMVVLLNMKSSRHATSMTRLRRSIQSIESADAVPGGMYMLKGDMLEVLDPERAAWTPSDIDGAESEIQVTLYSNSLKIRLVFRKWEGEDDPTVSVLPDSDGVQLYQHIVFSVRHVASGSAGEGLEAVRLYGDDGMFIDVLVRDAHIRKYRTMAEVLDGMASSGLARIIRR